MLGSRLLRRALSAAPLGVAALAALPLTGATAGPAPDVVCPFVRTPVPQGDSTACGRPLEAGRWDVRLADAGALPHSFSLEVTSEAGRVVASVACDADGTCTGSGSSGPNGEGSNGESVSSMAVLTTAGLDVTLPGGGYVTARTGRGDGALLVTATRR